jgi:hypothetical protein
MKIALLLVSILLLGSITTGAEEIEKKYYLKADFGMSLSLLANLNSELETQGSGGIDPGYAFGVSLARAFANARWALELYFSATYFPEFAYVNEFEDFPGKLRHTGFGAIAKYRFRPEARSFCPVLGAGIGYGTTELISGGGKIKGPEAVALFELEAWTWGNKSLLFGCTYTLGLTDGTFDDPFLENYETDVVRDSNGDPLSDRYSSLEVKIGILIWLGPLGN